MRTIKSGSHGCQPLARRTESVWALVIAPEGLLPHRRDVPVDQCLEWPQQLGAELRASDEGRYRLRVLAQPRGLGSHLELRRHPQPDVQQNRVVRSGAAGE